MRSTVTKALLAVLAAWTLGGCGVAGWITSAKAPATLDAWAVHDVSDGLNRLLVTVELPGPTRPTTTSSSSGGVTGSGPESRGTQRIDVGRLVRAQHRLGGHGHVGIDARGRVAWIVGRRSLPIGRATTPTPQPVQPSSKQPSSTQRGAAWLASQPWVKHAQATHSGQVLVATPLTPQQVAAQDGVKAVTRSETVPVASVSAPNDPYWSYAWHLKNTGFAQGQTATSGVDVGALDAWPRNQGNGVVVAVIDTGYYSSHPDLTGALWTNPKEACGSTDTDGDGHAGDCHGWNLYASTADVDNGAGGEHGTTVAGVIAAQLDNGVGAAGLAPQARIMPVVAGSGTNINMALATEAIYYAVDHGANIINASFGGTLTGTALTNLTNAVSYASTHGVLVVTAAGNDNANRDTSAVYPANLTLDNVVTVGSSDAADNKSDFSAWGKANVDLFAPGTSVVTTFNDGGYRLVSGTSIASPLVAAAAALAKSANPSMTPAQLRTALMSTGDHPAALANLSVSGARLSAGRLLAGTLRYTVDNGTGLVADTPGTVTVTASGSAPSTSPAMKLTLAYRQGGSVWAVAGVAVATSAGTGTTGDDGSVVVPVTGTAVDGGATAQVRVSLPQGDFALLSQLMSDGEPVGRPAVAILPVGSAAASQPPADGGDGSATQPSGGSTPTSSSGVPAQPTASATAAPTTGGVPTSTTSAPASAVPTSVASTPSTTTATTTSRPAPPRTVSVSPTSAATGGSASSSPTTSPTTPSTASGGAGGGGGSGSPTTNPSSGSTPPTTVVTPAPAPTKTYPGTDAFGVTSLSPSTVHPDGGTIVTVTGTNLPTTPRVTVAGVQATVMGGNSATQLAFYAPARAEGTYDVVLSEYPGTTSVTLSRALTYSTSAPAGNGGAGGGGDAQPTSQPTTSPTATGSATSPTVTSTSPLTVTGPGGLRLVHSDSLAALTASVWDAAPRCNGRCEAVTV